MDTVSSLSLQDIVCCMGQPLGRNPTQYMMEKAFAAAGLDWRYLTLEVAPENLAAAVQGMKAMGFRGGNYALPHQVAVVEHLDGLSEAAELTGAVNVVYVSDDKYIGDNTDGKGFVQSLLAIMEPTDTNVVILGAGGTARAIAVELGLAGAAEITIVNRTPDRGRALVDLLNEKVNVPAKLVEWDHDPTADIEADLLVNATAIGLGDGGAEVPVQVDSLPPQIVVADVVHNPPETKLVRDAAECGLKTLDGLAMLLNQAAIDFSIWTGVEPDTAVMREALEEYFEL